MAERFESFAPTPDPDAVERDPAAQSAAEELDEDRLRVDPLEAGMDPPERLIGADKYGMTPYEQRHPRGLSERLDEDQPEPDDVGELGRAADVVAEEDLGEDRREVGSEQADEVVLRPVADVPVDDAGLDEEVAREARDRGQTADEAGGSVAAVDRIADEPE